MTGAVIFITPHSWMRIQRETLVGVCVGPSEAQHNVRRGEIAIETATGEYLIQIDSHETDDDVAFIDETATQMFADLTALKQAVDAGNTRATVVWTFTLKPSDSGLPRWERSLVR